MNSKWLHNIQSTLFDSNGDLQANSIKRHSEFVKIIAMQSTDYNNRFQNLTLYYSFADSPFGGLIIANNEAGICYLAFEDSRDKAKDTMAKHFPNATFHLKSNDMQRNCLSIFNFKWNELQTINLYIKGTDFQIGVWNALLDIPISNIATYGEIANIIGDPKASRAVGTAIGDNPIAYIIPCHRVVRADGKIGNYMWGQEIKRNILSFERTYNLSK